LKVTSSRGDIHLASPDVTDDPAKVGPVDFAIVSVKLWDTEGAAQAVKPLIARGGAALSFQNGVHKDVILAKYLPKESIVGGVCYIAAVIAEPGVIHHSGAMQRFVFGEYGGGRSARTEALHQAFLSAGIDSEISQTIEILIWQKFVFLVGLSGTTSTIRKPIGPIRSDPRTRAFLLDVMREVVEVGRANGVALKEDYAKERLQFCDTLPESMTSSMHVDLERGNRLELPWLSGGVAELGAASGVNTPLNRAIFDILALYTQGRA
jgi:2-dehydropantoate 2-reductase